MPEKRKRKLVRRIAFAMGAVSLLLVFLLFGPPRLLEKSESPRFCASCHSMTEQHLSWQHSAHKTLKCVDCHLPNDNFFNHYLWKALDGSKDLFFELFPRREYWEISLTGHGAAVLQDNCLKCHAGVVSRMNRELTCYQCHREAGHKMTSRTTNLNSGGKDEKD